jgi:hypothetical protein
MERPLFGFAGYELVPPPPGGFWRVSTWFQPFEPPPPAPPLGVAPQDDDGHRYDDPDGRWATLYCATEPEGALGECLGDFKFDAAAVALIEAYLEGEPDAGHDEDYLRVLTARDVEAFEWKLAHAPAASDARLIDVEHWRTHSAVAARALRALLRYGVERIDRATLLDERRYVTRTLAGLHRDEATDPATGALRAQGLRFTSRLPPAWECWALWDPRPLHASAATVAEVTTDTPPLRSAAALLGIPLQA